MATIELDSVMPRDTIISHFSGKTLWEEWKLDGLDTIIRLCSREMNSLGLNCLMRVKNFTLPSLNVVPIVSHIRNFSPELILRMSDVIGSPCLKDIYCCRCLVGSEIAASLLIAEVYPRDLYIGMVSFADPSKPIPAAKRKSVLQKYHGLGLLKEFMSRVQSCAIARHCDYITLVANEVSHVGLYQKYGFAVDSNDYARGQFAQGKAIPMHKPAANSVG